MLFNSSFLNTFLSLSFVYLQIFETLIGILLQLTQFLIYLLLSHIWVIFRMSAQINRYNTALFLLIEILLGYIRRASYQLLISNLCCDNYIPLLICLLRQTRGFRFFVSRLLSDRTTFICRYSAILLFPSCSTAALILFLFFVLLMIIERRLVLGGDWNMCH